jgi:drug/metabolite transporter (DMT)-like permease
LLFAVAIMTTFVGRPAWRAPTVIWPHIGKLTILGFLTLCLFQVLSYSAAETTTATNLAVCSLRSPRY